MKEHSDEIIFVIDDDASVRRSLSLFLASVGYHVETLASSEEFISRETHQGTGCLILDVHLEGKSGLELQKELISKHVHLPIIFISGQGNIPMSVKALKRGAVNFLEKPFDDEILLRSISEALDLSRSLMKEEEDYHTNHDLVSSLTPREMQIAELVITGMLNKQIAGDLGIAEHTVKLHRRSICEKLGVKSVPEIIRIMDKAAIRPDDAD